MNEFAPVFTDQGKDYFSDQTFMLIGAIVRSRTGFDLASYKDKCMKRRIAIRMRATDCENADAYYELLQRNEAELKNLLRVLTIHVTQFFRNPATFRCLEEKIIPSLIASARQKGRDSLRLWSVGCATGEETYSLALILKEKFSDLLNGISVTILGTDVDGDVINLAREGVFANERLAEVPADVRDRYFKESAGKSLLAPEIINMVEFRQEDVGGRTSRLGSHSLPQRAHIFRAKAAGGNHGAIRSSTPGGWSVGSR